MHCMTLRDKLLRNDCTVIMLHQDCKIQDVMQFENGIEKLDEWIQGEILLTVHVFLKTSNGSVSSCN